MSWPTDTCTTTHLDAATDDPSQARAEIKTAVDAIKAVIAGRGTTSGVCDLDSSGYVPSGRLSATALTTALGYTPWHAGNDGAGSGLDADTLDGLHASQLTAFPSGTLMLFQQAAAPTGWTKQTTHNDKTLRVVSGTPSSGGSVAFSTVFGRTATDAHTLTTTQIPAHAHSVNINTGTVSSDHVHTLPCVDGDTAGGASGFVYETNQLDVTDQTTYGISANHYHNVSGNTANAGSGGSHTHNIDLRVNYVDVIIASKD